MKKIFVIISFLLLILISIIFLIVFITSKKTNRPINYFPNLIYQALKQNQAPDYLNMIILGLDRRNDWLEKTETTDTIIFSQINFKQNKIKLFSLPRDLWNYFTASKINQIYPMSKNRENDVDSFTYISKNFASISGQPVNRVLVLSTDNLKQLADILGGIDIFLENGFIDEKYPNEAYIQNPNSDAPMYKTIEFKTGWVHLDSNNITEFVRSRKSSETASSGGTDLGRIERQQQLINALIDKLKLSVIKNPLLVFDLYNYWQNLEQNFTDLEFVSYLLKNGLKLKDISIQRYPISSGENPKTDIFYHPQRFINSQWVFIPQDRDYRLFQEYLSNSLSTL
ncbi:MAG TPA: LCP family protein [Candidatus Methanoperedens sp.]|nr:LCP family protein [Candidatus Methanoperedens sp.]